MSKPYTIDAITTAWTHVVPDSLQFETEGLHANKQTVEIRTRDIYGQLDGNTRRIATSDLFQCFWTVETKADLDKARRSLKRMQATGKDLPERLKGLDNLWRAQTELCTLDHPRIKAAQDKLNELAKADAAREERKADKAKPSVEEAAAKLI